MDEGAKPADWPGTLRRRGIEVSLSVRREEAAQVLRTYAASGGFIYNGRRADDEPHPPDSSEQSG